MTIERCLREVAEAIAGAPSRKRALCVLAILAGAWAATTLSTTALDVTHGLRAEYFSDPGRRGTPRQTVDQQPSTAAITAHWLGDPPPAFSVRWFGYLMVGSPGQYTVGTRSDDGSWLTIDGRLVVDNGGSHPAATRTASIYLDSGPHPVLIEYVQDVADFEMSFLWGPDEDSLSPVPAWRLSPNRVVRWKLVAARVFDWLSIATLTLLLTWAFRAASIYWGNALGAAVRSHPRTAALLLFVVLAAAETWPLAAHPASLSRNNNADTVLNEWALAWVAHQAPRAPLQLYDANIFFPERGTLAYSEAMIVQAAMAAPLLWSGASPVLAYNLVLLAGFVLSGWAMSIVIARWTGSWAAGLASGIIFAFNAHSLTRMPHLQAQHVEFLPLALLALDELFRDPRLGRAVRLALLFTLQALTSIHLLVFSAVALIAAAVVRPKDWLGRRFMLVVPRIAMAAALASLALLPFLMPYWYAYDHHGLSRPLRDAEAFSASWRDYLSTPARFHYAWWSHRFFTASALFPGAIALALAGLAMVRGVAFTNPAARMWLALGAAGVVLSFGTQVPGYAALYEAAPPLRAIRAVSRFGFLGIAGVAALAGFGLAELKRMVPGRLWTPLAGLVLTLVALEPFSAPIRYTRFDGIPGIYRQLRDVPDAVVVEFPFHSGVAGFANASYMLNSTEHFKPMVNGYSGFVPLSYHRNFEVLWRFPDARSVDWLQALGVTHAFVHLDQMGPQTVDSLDRTPELERIALDGRIALYRVRRPN